MHKAISRVSFATVLVGISSRLLGCDDGVTCQKVVDHICIGDELHWMGAMFKGDKTIWEPGFEYGCSHPEYKRKMVNACESGEGRRSCHKNGPTKETVAQCARARI